MYLRNVLVSGGTSIFIAGSQQVSNNLYSSTFNVYVGSGQKISTARSLFEFARSHSFYVNTIFVVSGAASSAPEQFLAPYTGATVGEIFREVGLAALVVFDDLSKQANAYRQMSLLLRRPPGREAYPGDVFYIHSRLLERAAKLSNILSSGGSLTALPIVETLQGDVSAYISTNVISITDGQIFLETDQFLKGIKPAVSYGLSVSRVGSSAQFAPIRKLAGSLKLDMAQFREIEEFAQFDSELDPQSQLLVTRGTRFIEVLKQAQVTPMPYNLQLFSLYLAVGGYLDKTPLEKVRSILAKLVFFAHVHMSLFRPARNCNDVTADVAKLIRGTEEPQATPLLLMGALTYLFSAGTADTESLRQREEPAVCNASFMLTRYSSMQTQHTYIAHLQASGSTFSSDAYFGALVTACA